MSVGESSKVLNELRAGRVLNRLDRFFNGFFRLFNSIFRRELGMSSSPGPQPSPRTRAHLSKPDLDRLDRLFPPPGMKIHFPCLILDLDATISAMMGSASRHRFCSDSFSTSAAYAIAAAFVGNPLDGCMDTFHASLAQISARPPTSRPRTSQQRASRANRIWPAAPMNSRVAKRR